MTHADYYTWYVEMDSLMCVRIRLDEANRTNECKVMAQLSHGPRGKQEG